MVKRKSLKDEQLDPMDEVQELLEKQQKSIIHIESELLDIIESYSEKLLNSSPQNAKFADERTATILKEILRQELERHEKHNCAEIEHSIANYLNDEKIRFNEYIAGLSKNPSANDAGQIPTYNSTKKLNESEINNFPISPTIKDFCRLAYSRCKKWIDAKIGLCYIRHFFRLIAFFIWIISIGTAVFIIRENYTLREAEEKYDLLRNECRKYQQTNEFVNKLELIFSDKDEFQNELQELIESHLPSKIPGKP